MIARVASFVQVEEIEEGLNVGAVLAANLLQAFLESWSTVVAPAAFAHEVVPYLDLLVARAASAFEAPLEDFRIGSALVHPLHYGRVVEIQKRKRPGVETLAQIRVIIFREFARGVEANFVEHSADIIDAANLIVRTSEAGNLHSR